MSQTILIIKSEAAQRRTLGALLKTTGFQILEAPDTALAMQLFLHEYPDLVLLDADIADDHGLDLLQAIKKIRFRVPVLIMSAQTDIAHVSQAFRAGAWDYIPTPIADTDAFISSLRTCLVQTSLQERRREAQGHLFQLVQKLPIIIFVINNNLEFEFLNQSTEEILGYQPQEIIRSPRPFLKRIVPEDRRRFLRALRQNLKPNAGDFHLDFSFVHRKGYRVALQAQSLGATHGPSAQRRVEGMILDVTQTSYMDKLLLQNEKLTMLRTMTEEMAHELRNPLVSLGGFARQLRNRFPEARETEIIFQECDRLERLVQRVSSYLEPFEINLTSCDLPAILAFDLRILAPRLTRKDITCTLNISPDLVPLQADQDFLHRIFLYLISHCLDRLDNGGTLTMSAEQSQTLTHITITMHPVPPAHRDYNRLLVPFDGDNLAICYRLMERMGGVLCMERLESTTVIKAALPTSPATTKEKSGLPAVGTKS